jgi:hypothetical protein
MRAIDDISSLKLRNRPCHQLAVRRQVVILRVYVGWGDGTNIDLDVDMS